MANHRDSVYGCGYFDDAGQEWIVSLTESIANWGGFAAPTAGVIGPLPPRCKMRHVGLVDPTTGKRKTVPCATLSTTIFASAAYNVDDANGVQWYKTGKIGEHFPL